MKSLVHWAIRNSPSINTLMIAVLTIGAVSLTVLRRERFPDFRPDEIRVTVPYPGASPTETEEGICLKVEEAIRAIVGIRKLTSIAEEGEGRVTAELDTNVDDPQRVLNEIRSAIDRIPTFPENSEKPEVKLLQRYQSVVSIALLAPPRRRDGSPAALAAERQHRELTEQVYNEVLRLSEVSHVDIWQAKPYQIDVELSEDALRKYGLSHAEVTEAIRRGNVELPAGEIKTKGNDVLVRAANQHVVGVDIAKLPVVTTRDGTVLRVGDLGEVHDGFADIDMFAEINCRPAMSVKIRMTPNEDMLEIRNQVQAYADGRPMPEGYELIVWDDYSLQARQRLELLSRNAIAGLLLVLVVLCVFLDFRLAFWVALGIPVSVLGTCAVMWYFDATLNMHSMFAFVMALGIVVDDAIVIAENVYAHRLRGVAAIQAAIDGTVEVAPSVISSVLTTVVAFIPLAFVSGEMGKWIAVMPLALISILLLSLFESIVILPCHLAHSRLPEDPSSVPRLQSWFQSQVTWFIDHIYTPVLRWSLTNPAIVLSVSLGSLLIAAGLYVGGRTPFVLNQRLDYEFVYTYIDYPKGTPAEVVDQATARLAASFREVEQELQAGGESLVRLTYRGVGYTTQLDNLRGEMYIEFHRDRAFTGTNSNEIINRWRERAGEFPGAERVVFWGINNSPGGKPIELSLLGDDIGRLEEVVGRIKDELAGYAGVHDIHDSRGPGKWELQLKMQREAESMGVRLEDVAQTVRAAYYGDEVMRLQRGRHEVKLMVRYSKPERHSLASLNEVHVRTAAGDEIPLPVLAQVDVQRGFAQILRIDQQRAVTLTADVDESQANARNIVRDLQSGFLTALMDEYPDVSIRWEGQQEETRQSTSSLMLGFLFAIFAMYGLLTLKFRSYFQPVIILAIIPFGFVGAVFGHLFMDYPITLFSLFGVVTLSGIIANDSIVLIDFVNRRRAAGVAFREAILESGQQRFRPVILTSITTVAALMPILMERNTQAQVLIPMAISISFGLMLATVWVLLLTPIMYEAYARAQAFFEKT
jgi:multidrug efflux pump subunit AcrB